MLAAVLVVLASALAAGCGDGESDAARQWADSVCSSIGDWRSDIQANVEELQRDPGAISADSLRAAADESLQSTQALLDAVRELGAPETESGEQARDELEQLLQSLEERAGRVRDAAAAAEEGIAQVLLTVAAISTEIQGAADDARGTIRELQELEPGSELAEAFRDEDACQALED